MKYRPSWDEYFMGIAFAVAEPFLRPLFACLGLSGVLAAAVLWILSK